MRDKLDFLENCTSLQVMLTPYVLQNIRFHSISVSLNGQLYFSLKIRLCVFSFWSMSNRLKYYSTPENFRDIYPAVGLITRNDYYFCLYKLNNILPCSRWSPSTPPQNNDSEISAKGDAPQVGVPSHIGLSSAVGHFSQMSTDCSRYDHYHIVSRKYFRYSM